MQINMWPWLSKVKEKARVKVRAKKQVAAPLANQESQTPRIAQRAVVGAFGILRHVLSELLANTSTVDSLDHEWRPQRPKERVNVLDQLQRILLPAFLANTF